MSAAQERHVIDETDKRVAAVIDVKAYHKIPADSEALEAVRAHDAANAGND